MKSANVHTSKKIIIASGILALVAVAVIIFQDRLVQFFFRPTQTNFEVGVTTDSIPDSGNNIEIVAQNLSVPWELAFLPSGAMLVTERGGTLKEITINGDERIIAVPSVEAVGEGGLLGLALHPDFERNNYLYLYITTSNKDGLINRVERYTYQKNLSNKTTIIDNIPGASYHDGGRIAFGPDGLLYITTGDAGETWLSQQTDSLAGKTLRLNDDGSIPEGNPFKSPVYSYGHRNSQGMAWDSEGQLWQTEHGRSGAQSGMDELNLITAGSNYGWPEIEGDITNDSMESPVIHSGASETWAPAGMAYHEGSLFFTGLRGQSLYQATFNNSDDVVLKVHFHKEFGRLRNVVVGPDNFLYLLTNNTDGRGSPFENDDKIIRINPDIF